MTTRHRLVVVHAVPIGRAAGHAVSVRCPCRPDQNYVDLAEPSTVVVVVHRDRPVAATIADLDERSDDRRITT